jgi:hypothetical protein
LTQGFGASFPTTLWAALAVFPLAYFLTFEVLMGSPHPEALARRHSREKGETGSGNGSGQLDDDSKGKGGDKDAFTSSNPLVSSSSPPAAEIATASMGEDGHNGHSNNMQSDIHVNDTPCSTGTDATDVAGAMNRNTSAMTFQQRVRATAVLWPYMVPLFTVYAAE